MNDEQLLHYSRHIMLPQLDMAGQEKLLAAKVLIVGLGGLGSPVAMYLAASGVGCLYLNDFDLVDIGNLQRQILHRVQSIGGLKTRSAKESLVQLNTDCQIIELSDKLDKKQLLTLLPQVDVVVDCSDNFETRSLLNEVCVQMRKPLVSGAAIRFEGQVTVFRNQLENDACYSCLYPALSGEQETCSEAGVLSPLVGVIGAIQAIETIKVITGLGEILCNKLLVYDGLQQEFRKINFKRDSECSVCGER